MIIKMLQVGAIGTNCYIVEDEEAKRAAIIDPGDDADQILAAVARDDPDTRPACILLTHGHYDHTSAIPELLETLPDIPIFIHRDDYVNKPRDLFTLPPDLPNIRFYDEGDKVKVGSLYIEVLMHTPGHSAGSVVLRVEDVLFTGDTLFRGSCGRTDFPDGDYGQILQSLKRLARLEGDYTVCPGHEGTTKLSTERATNYYMIEAMRH